jgi:hypothetical protein
MKEAIKSSWEKRPLSLILFLGIFFRLLAVIFSKGFGMHDDHFLIVESSSSWVDGYDYNDWLPRSGATTPDGHSMFYIGLHYLLFLYLKWRGLMDPQGRMYIVRALNAIWSLLTIIYGYKIAAYYGGKKVAKQAGLLLSILWFMPMLSVRDLVEMYCIPALMIATWLLIDPERTKKMKTFFWCGIFCGIAFNTRYQSMLFIAPLGLLVLLQNKWKPFFIFSLGFVLSLIPIQVVVDYMIWKKPFAEFFQYVHINANNYEEFTKGPWYNYLLLIGGMVIPPIGLFVLFGFFRSFRKYPLLFWPSFVFLAFHSSFPNKQERFILPIVPFVIILGLIGWNEFISKSAFWQKRPKLMTYSWTFFWVLNLIALPVISTMYSKKNRVESMTYLRNVKNLQGFMIEESNCDNTTWAPRFYLGNWKNHEVGITKTKGLVKTYLDYHGDPHLYNHPNYVIFMGQEDFPKRLAAFKQVFPHTDSVTTIYPSFMDQLLYWLNPINKNQTTYIYHFTEKDMHLPDSVHESPSAIDPAYQ